jgi:hypothetical protein
VLALWGEGIDIDHARCRLDNLGPASGSQLDAFFIQTWVLIMGKASLNAGSDFLN